MGLPPVQAAQLSFDRRTIPPILGESGLSSWTEACGAVAVVDCVGGTGGADVAVVAGGVGPNMSDDTVCSSSDDMVLAGSVSCATVSALSNTTSSSGSRRLNEKRVEAWLVGDEPSCCS